MKILIISLPRTGSTSLMEKLSKENNIPYIFEPWDGTERQSYKSTDENLVLKTMIFDKENVEETNIDFYIRLSKEFDQVILLSRRNLNHSIESYAYFKHHKSEKFNSRQQYKWEPTPNLEDVKYELTYWNDVLNQLSDKLKIDITYYEDIYDLNSYEKLRKEIKVDKLI